MKIYEREKGIIGLKKIKVCIMLCVISYHTVKNQRIKTKEQIGMKQNKNMMCLPFLASLYSSFCMLCTGFTLFFMCIWSKARLLLPWCNWKITFDATHTIHHASSFWRALIDSAILRVLIAQINLVLLSVFIFFTLITATWMSLWWWLWSLLY